MIELVFGSVKMCQRLQVRHFLLELFACKHVPFDGILCGTPCCMVVGKYFRLIFANVRKAGFQGVGNAFVQQAPVRFPHGLVGNVLNQRMPEIKMLFRLVAGHHQQTTFNQHHQQAVESAWFYRCHTAVDDGCQQIQ